MQRVVITGLGIVSCIGNDLTEVRNSLYHGRSGIEFVPRRKELGFRSALAGTLKNFHPPIFDKEFERQMGDGARLALTAALQATADAQLDESQLRSDRTGVIVGNVGNMHEVFEFCHTKSVLKKKLPSLALARTMGSSASANLNVALGTRGQCYSICAACASGAMAIGHAAQWIRLGMQDRIIAGGVQEGSWEFDCQFDALRVFSSREHAPTEASRPYDKYRDGLVPSVGAGLVVLENREQALARGARIYAELIGVSSNSDGYNITTPSGVGSVRCMEMALADAGIGPEQVQYINSHATSTKVGDTVEAQGIAEVFGDRPFVSSTKSMTGHEIGAAGSNELIYTLLMMQGGFVAPNINVEEVDESCRCINLVTNHALPTQIGVAMSNSFGFGGVNSR